MTPRVTDEERALAVQSIRDAMDSYRTASAGTEGTAAGLALWDAIYGLEQAARAELAEARAIVENIRGFHGGAMTAGCDAECGECSVCAILDCPAHEPLHYHHDGCPVCSFDDTERARRDGAGREG